MSDRIPILTGPTAVGKTALSLALAGRLDAEIISADSRQIYRGMDVGTAKPDSTILKVVRHHFIDELDPGARYSAGRFQKEAYRRIEQIHERGKSVLVVGGSTLYIEALKRGLADIPRVPRSIRDAVQDRLMREGADALYKELQSVDPRSADSMDATKTQRLVRALEVYESTGRPLSSFHEKHVHPSYTFRTFVLNRDRRSLYARIESRVDRMFSEGLLDEVRSLLSKGIDLSVNPMRTIGYKEPVRYLRGEISFDEMVRLVKRNTRRYAKRQLTWFRRDPENVWLDGDRPTNELLDAIVSDL